MGRRLYVGNLSYGTTDERLREMFEEHGSVTSAQIIMDRDTGRSKGFGFVEMGTDQEAQAAIEALNGQQIDGRALTVNEARPKTEGGGGRGGYGDGRGYGGGGRDGRGNY
jgi:RNA recognition motif-containing protein